MSKSHDSIFGNPNSLLIDEIKSYLELEGLRPSQITLRQIQLQLELNYERGQSTFQYLYQLVDKLKEKKKKNKRDYEKEAALRLASENNLTLDEAISIMASKKAQDVTNKTKKAQELSAKLEARKLYCEKDGFTREFLNFKEAILWYADKYGYKYSGAKTLITRFLKREDLRDANGYRFWRNK
jgi:hypothetical protein